MVFSQDGCMDVDACNYDATVIVDDGSCVLVDGICETCSGETDGTEIPSSLNTISITISIRITPI